MFNADFYPTPENVIHQMLEGYDVHGRTILEPSAGKGDIVDVLIQLGAKEVIACEKNTDLQKIVAAKCKVIADDFLKVESHQVSHVDFIIMNPPFSADEKHINHAWEICPAGCTIIALCNLATVESDYNRSRKRLGQLIEEYGNFIDLGECFTTAERKTKVRVALVRMQKPGSNESEFDGFFLGDDPAEHQENGLMSYNVVRDLVQRYVESIKIFDQQLDTAIRLNELQSEFFDGNLQQLSVSYTRDGAPLKRTEFKKQMQRQGWQYIFDKMNMKKHTTRGLKEDINKFVEQQTHIPFTMRNIYQMLTIVAGTTGQRMDKALLEVFDKLTEHTHENRHNVEGWKTNSHYMLNKRFIFPYAAEKDWDGRHVSLRYSGASETLNDVEKALCFISGENYDKINGFGSLERKLIPGQWYFTHFFKLRAYKKGTVHCEFQSEDVWGNFNQRVAKLKGYPLFEYRKTKHTEKQDQETAKRYQPPQRPQGDLFTVERNNVLAKIVNL